MVVVMSRRALAVLRTHNDRKSEVENVNGNGGLLRRRRVVRGVLSVLCVLAACESREEEARATMQVDTIGSVVHIRHAVPVSADTLRPRLTIGGPADSETGAPDEFGRINSVLLDSVGNVYVADAHAFEVRVFSPAGEFLRAFGRSGGGPGEFRSLQSLATMGDTLLALDGGNARIHLLTYDGDPLGSWQWLPFTGAASMVRFYPAGARDITVLGFNGTIRLGATGPADTLSHARADDDPDTMLRCPRADQGISFFPIPFAGRRIAVPAPGGNQASAWSGEYRIAITTEAGDTLRMIERAYAPLPISDEQWESATAEYRAFREQWPGARCTPADMTRPEAQAALQGIYFDHDGRMVVEVTADQMTRYDFYDEQGRADATVYVPLRSTSVVPYFRRGRIAQVATDSLDVQFVQVFEQTDELQQ